jgi:hypothetical protein
MIQKAISAEEPEPSPWIKKPEHYFAPSEIGEAAANFLWQMQRLLGHRISITVADLRDL